MFDRRPTEPVLLRRRGRRRYRFFAFFDVKNRGRANRPGTRLPEDPQNLFFCAAVEDGATASSRSSTSKNEASRANRPGTRLPEDPQNAGATVRTNHFRK
jgi:hypothetical protein